MNKMNDYRVNATAMNEDLERYDTVIIGLGKTGLSCVHYLQRQGDSHFAVMDSRVHPPQLDALKAAYPGVPVYLGQFDARYLCAAERIILSPGVAIREPAIQQALDKGVMVLGDIELFLSQVNKPVVAVTGSNGKSTVVSLLSAMIEEADLEVALGGNIGTPALDLLALPEPDFYVLELSSFQLERVNSLNAIASAVLNISADHMDRYPDMDSYAAAKRRIYQGQGKVIVNLDDVISSAWSQSSDRDCVTYATHNVDDAMFGLAKIDADRWLTKDKQPLMSEAELGMSGTHNLSNALAALALGSAISLPMPAMLNSLRKFTGLDHRCQFVRQIDGINWYNDSKATNVGATCAAIEGLASGENIILIAGGDGKGADFAPLLDSARGRVRAVVLLGKDAKQLAAVFHDVIPVCFATNMPAAVSAAASLAVSGDRVLLSPACASLDMFSDYQERGQVFMRAVKELTIKGGKQ